MSPALHFLLWRLRLAEATTQTTRAERDALARHATGRKAAVELGVWHGVTTRRLRAAIAPDGELWAVDPYALGRLGVSFPKLIAHTEVDGIENGLVRWVEKTGAEAARLWQTEARKPADFVFIDGDHTWEGIKSDWDGWSGLVAPHGIVALHDSRSTPGNPIDSAGSVRFTREVIHGDARYRVIDEVDSLTVLERNA